MIATMCIGYSGFEDGGADAVVATILLGCSRWKVPPVRWAPARLAAGAPRRLAAGALRLTWLTSPGDFLGVS